MMRIETKRTLGLYRNCAIRRRCGQTEKVLISFKQAVEIRKRLVREHPDAISYRRGLGGAYDKLAVAQRENGQLDPALASHGEAIRILDELAKDTEVFQHQHDLASAYCNFGALLDRFERDEEAIRAYEDAKGIYERLLEADPLLIDVQAAIGGYQCNIGHVRRNLQRYAEADESFGDAIRTLTDALRRVPQHSTSRSFLRNSYWGKAESLEAQKRREKASLCWERAVHYDEGQAHLLLRTCYAASLARAGQHVRSIQIAESLLQSKYLERYRGYNAYNAACIYALSAESARRDRALAPENRQKTADEYGKKPWANLDWHGGGGTLTNQSICPL